MLPPVSTQLPNDEPRRLVMYSRTSGCPFITVAKRILDDYRVPYEEIFIDRDDAARARVIAWTGFLSVPTLVVARPGEVLPISLPTSLPRGASPRGIDRGSMITEASSSELLTWLSKHGFIRRMDADEAAR
ncbi:MAG: glutaredoxin family protein [Anaerolineae bacterium]|nr:glutaredoxin family protein [Anaerolineae bacterium]MDW8173348.1 glutaredoxin family protein [Anaerolineae bacterium]